MEERHLGVATAQGIYITGGVTKKMREWLLTEGSFMKAYYDKGADTRDSSWLSGDVGCIARIAEEHFIEQSNGE